MESIIIIPMNIRFQCQDAAERHAESCKNVAVKGNVVIMGRLSYEEIGKPLPNRTTIVVSGTKEFTGENCFTAKSLAEAIEMAGDRDAYISGGARLYEEALPLVEKMYITEIDLDVEGDTYFPVFDKEQFVKEVNEKFDGEIPYTYVTYTRKRAEPYLED